MTGAFPSKKVGATSLMYACQQGKDTQVLNIVSAKPGAVLERERTLKTALHYCAESGDGGVSSAAVLLEAAPELVLAQDQDGYSALHLAVIAGNLALTKLLISRGAPVNMPDNEGHTPAHWATVCGEIDCLELLLGKGCNPNLGDMHGGCPLHYAAQMCGPFSDMPADRRLGMAALRILLDNSSDPNLPDNHGRQPILWAASAGSSEAILALVGAGANVAAADKDGLTALHCAASRGHTDCVETLINLCSAEPDVIDNNGCSALFYAVTLGHADATQTLLNHGASTNRQDRKGRTAVHCGAAKGQLETLKVVAAWEGNMWQKTVRGDYPLHDAVASGRRPLVHWLLSQRPDSVNAPNNDGRCSLHIAAIHNNIEMCKTLLDAGSLVNPVMRTAKGALATPLDAALHKGHRGCAKYLQLHGGVPASRLNSESAALRGLSSNRGDGNRTIIPLLSKELSENKLQAVEEVEVLIKPDTKPVRIGSPASEDQFPANEKDRLPSGTRPHILQVYVEDDLMIRKLRHYEGSDSSIEERVRRRRRKRKTRLMAEREKSAPARISPRKFSSSDETVDPKSLVLNKGPTDNKEKEVMVEKLVQTEFSVQPDSKQGRFENLIIESIKDVDSVSHNDDKSSDKMSESKVINGSNQENSSGDSNKKGTVQLVEAIVHKEQKSSESDEHKASTEEPNEESGMKDADVKSELPDSSVVVENVSETIEIAKSSEPKTEEGTINPDVVKSSSTGDSVDLLPRDEKAEDTKKDAKTHYSDDDFEQLIPETHENQAQHNEPLEKKEPDAQQNEEASSLATKKEDEIIIPNEEETTNVNTTNDKSVAKLQALPEDNDMSSNLNQPSSLIIEESSELEKHEGSFEVNHIPTLQNENYDVELNAESYPEVSLVEQPESKQTDNLSDSENGNIMENQQDKLTTVESINVSAAENADQQVLSSEPILLNEEKHVNLAPTLLEKEAVTTVTSALEQPADRSEDQENFSKDSFDIEGSLDELTLNITKDSDDAPPELGLPDPIVDEGWEKTLEADRVAANVLLAHEDRGLIKVLGDPTGGSSYVADKRRKLRKKREGNKKWMNSRSTESFEVLKISDEKTDEEGVSDVEKPIGDEELRKSSTKEESKGSSHDDRKFSRPCRRDHESNSEMALSTVSVTQAVQYSVRKYHLERRIFHQLLELKRLQIRAGRASEAVLVKRLVDEYKKAGLMLGLQQYDGVYTFRSFEKFLYEQLRLLQTSERRIIPRLRSTDDLERLTAALRKTRVGQEILASVPNNPALCTYQTHRCHHATHAYTGVPCAAYIARPNHHTMPKPTPYSGFLPKLVNDENQAEVAKTLRHVDPSRPLTLELSHGPDKQVITLPTEKLDRSKKYFVTFTIKSGSQKKSELKHSHATSI